METHRTVPIQVWVDVDEGIVQMVMELNTIPGVRTWSSCQGMADGPHPYPPHVMVAWDTDETFVILKSRYKVLSDGFESGDHWCYFGPDDR
jgi:hypothetical protein